MRSKLQTLVHISVVTAILVAAIGIVPASASFTGRTALTKPGSDEVVLPLPLKLQSHQVQEIEGNPLLRDEWYYDRRTAGDPSVNFTMAEAATLRAKAAEQAATMLAQQAHVPAVPNAFG